MVLQITKEEYRRLQSHIEFSKRCSKTHHKVPKEKVNAIILSFYAGDSIGCICKEFHIGRNTFYKIRAEEGF